jgi:hypothetical protein
MKVVRPSLHSRPPGSALLIQPTWSNYSQKNLALLLKEDHSPFDGFLSGKRRNLQRRIALAGQRRPSRAATTTASSLL